MKKRNTTKLTRAAIAMAAVASVTAQAEIELAEGFSLQGFLDVSASRALSTRPVDALPERTEVPEKAPTGKKQKVTETTLAEQEPQSSEVGEGPDVALWGGIAALTLGAFALARRRS